MKSFEPGVLERQTVPASLLRTARLLGEHRGRDLVSACRRPDVLDRLRSAALVDSVGSSCRLDGVSCPVDRIRHLLGGGEPANRSEQEIAGYRDAWLTAVCADGDFAPRLVLELHARLCGHLPERGGSWKIADNLVTEALPDGSTVVRFTPVPAYAVEDAMGRLHDRFAAQLRAGVTDPLLLVASYLIDFLAVHPFSEGNGRMMRLLAPLLLRRVGFEVATLVSLDPFFEGSRPACAAALEASWRGWHQGKHNLAPWWTYFLTTVLRACEQAERELASDAPVPRGAKRDMVSEAVRRLPVEFRHEDVERLVPGVSQPTINRALARMRASREIRCVRPGRNARWRRILTS